MVLRNTRFILSVENGSKRVRNIVFNGRNRSGISKHPCIFLFIIQTTVFSSNIKYPEAMIDDCLKSDNFHM